MDGWTPLTADVVVNAMPTDVGALYRAWVDANPGKASRLGELVAEVLLTIREAVACNPINELDTSPDTVPAIGFRHALNMVIFHLGMEMGVQFAPEVYTLTTRADIWLRMLQNGSIRVGGREGDGSPSYRAPENGRSLP